MATTRKQFEDMLSYGQKFRPKEITDRKFYFFKGYIIEIFENGGFYLSKRHMYYSNRPIDTLKFAMDEIIKIKLADFDKEERIRNTINKTIQAKVEPFITDIIKTSLEELTV